MNKEMIIFFTWAVCAWVYTWFVCVCMYMAWCLHLQACSVCMGIHMIYVRVHAYGTVCPFARCVCMYVCLSMCVHVCGGGVEAKCMYHLEWAQKWDNIFTRKTTAKTAFLQHTLAVSSINSYYCRRTHIHKIQWIHVEFAYMWQLSLDIRTMEEHS